MHLWREDPIGMRVEGVEKSLIVGLVLKIELAQDAAPRALHGADEVDRLQGGEALLQLAGEPDGQVEVDLHRAAEIGLLDLDGHVFPG